MLPCLVADVNLWSGSQRCCDRSERAVPLPRWGEPRGSRLAVRPGFTLGRRRLMSFRFVVDNAVEANGIVVKYLACEPRVFVGEVSFREIDD